MKSTGARRSARGSVEPNLGAGGRDEYLREHRVLDAFTTDLFVKSYIQWNDLDEKVSANVLVGWEYRPGSEIYLVHDKISPAFEGAQGR